MDTEENYEYSNDIESMKLLQACQYKMSKLLRPLIIKNTFGDNDLKLVK